MRKPVADAVKMVKAGHHVGFIGLHHCHSGSGCPHCTPLKRAEDAALVSALVEHHGSHRTYMLSLTTRHAADRSGEAPVYHELGPTYEGQVEAYRRMTKGKPWERFCKKWGLAWTIRAADHRHSWANGHHPHFHVLLMLGRSLTDVEFAEVSAWISERWSRMVVKMLGEAARPSDEPRYDREGVFIGSVGCTITECRNADYITKLGLELTLDETKDGKNGSRSPWQIAWDLAERQDPRDGRLWQEYVAATKGKQLVRFSGKGRAFAKELLEKAEEEKQKTEDAERQVEGAEDAEEEVTIAKPTWYEVRDLHGGTRVGGDAWDARARLREAARKAEAGTTQAAVDAEIAALQVEFAGHVSFVRAERQRQADADAAALQRLQEEFYRRQAETAARRARESREWVLRHRLAGRVPEAELEAWLARQRRVS